MYRRSQPWVADHPLAPKSVVRDMWERAMTFADYVQHYGLARSEGTLLRYLSSGYKALVQTVPESAKTDELYDLTEWLGELVRQVDSSLLDEWEALAHPEVLVDEIPTTVDHTPPPVTANDRAFRVLVRNELFRRVELAATRRVAALGELDGEHGWERGAVGRGARRVLLGARDDRHRRCRSQRGALRGGCHRPPLDGAPGA